MTSKVFDLLSEIASLRSTIIDLRTKLKRREVEIQTYRAISSSTKSEQSRLAIPDHRASGHSFTAARPCNKSIADEVTVNMQRSSALKWELNSSQRKTQAALRKSLMERQNARTARVKAAWPRKGEVTATSEDRATWYTFMTGFPRTTEVVVQRGVIEDLTTAHFEVIPLSSASSPLYVFTDETVDALYGAQFVRGLRELGYVVSHKYVLPDGEAAKTLGVYTELANDLLSRGIDKHSILISLGGGAIANVCGFIASTLHRGIGLIHFPTTLLAQCDACISHKQAVNAPHGKNLIGAFYAPIRIVVDVAVLRTLDDWLLSDGFGEIVKHALCQDVHLLEFLEAYDNGPECQVSAVKLKDPDFLDKVVRWVIRLKCSLINSDPTEKGEGAVLLYGHTVCHPVETLSHRPSSKCCLSHGQAVAIGCIVEARIGAMLGTCDYTLVDRHVKICCKYLLPTKIPSDQSIDHIMDKMRFNKTWTAEGSLLTLPANAGRLFHVDGQFLLPVDSETIQNALRATLAPPGTNIQGLGSSGHLRRLLRPGSSSRLMGLSKASNSAFKTTHLLKGRIKKVRLTHIN